MCGITAIVSPVPDLGPRLQAMTCCLKHRGPDDEGFWTDPPRQLGLGQRRLAILDLSKRGHQPMKSLSGDTLITFNGEVYNFGDLRPRLTKAGFRFRSKTDTEVVLHAYEAWGVAAVKEFNGMWAFVLYDRRNHRLVASRDRLGIKPLYYYWDGTHLVLASEIKAILASGLVKTALEPEGLNEYFTFQNILSDRTLFKDIRMLPAGSNLVFDLKTQRLTIEPYWDLHYQPRDLTEAEFSAELRKAFRRAMDRHLISDVDVGATISGGMDSSAITALATQHFDRLHTFTGYFDTDNLDSGDRSVSERDSARLISQRFGTTHHERLIHPADALATLPQIVWHLEDPKVAMCYTFYLMAQLVSQSVKVNLSGSGGDEAFAGYPWRYELIADKTDPAAFDAVYYDYWSRLVKDGDKGRFFTQLILDQINLGTPRTEYQRIIQAAGAVSPVNKALYFENKTFLHGMLMVEDKMGMAFSLETRVPFLDNEMIDISLAVPDDLKYRNGESKYLLKKAFASLLPPEIITKRKQGFTPPDQTWYRRELRDAIAQLLTSPGSRNRVYIEPAFVSRILAELNAGSDHRLLIWSLMFFEWWCRIFLEGEMVPPPPPASDGLA
ncbi:asparagine synthase (glutamine-hydrolyzing) [Candidatus Berkelbacteria bacterium]|nr:asparagine synthase (glutamine-hydrolyzing) [Candidatus Berkelbacteria bacterium]